MQYMLLIYLDEGALDRERAGALLRGIDGTHARAARERQYWPPLRCTRRRPRPVCGAGRQTVGDRRPVCGDAGAAWRVLPGGGQGSGRGDRDRRADSGGARWVTGVEVRPVVELAGVAGGAKKSCIAASQNRNRDS